MTSAQQAQSARESLRICRKLAESIPAFGQLVTVYEREVERCNQVNETQREGIEI